MKRITTLKQLLDAALDRRSIVCPKTTCWRGPIPAAFVINQQGRVLFNLMQSGMYLYEKPKRNKKPLLPRKGEA